MRALILVIFLLSSTVLLFQNCSQSTPNPGNLNSNSSNQGSTDSDNNSSDSEIEEPELAMYVIDSNLVVLEEPITLNQTSTFHQVIRGFDINDGLLICREVVYSDGSLSTRGRCNIYDHLNDFEAFLESDYSSITELAAPFVFSEESWGFSTSRPTWTKTVDISTHPPMQKPGEYQYFIFSTVRGRFIESPVVTVIE